MSQRVHCTTCLDWEILKYDGPRPATWTCSKCGAKPVEGNVYVLRFGNHYLLSDPGMSFEHWVVDLGTASRHSFEWAEKFRTEQAKKNRDVEVYTFEGAVKLAQISSKSRLDWEWMGAFEGELHRLMKEDGKPLSEYTYRIQGVGCAKYHFTSDDYKAKGMNAKEAARDFYKKNPPRLAKKPKKVKKTPATQS